jgi:hypothetical protein
VALGALTALANALGLPLGVDGVVAGIASALAGIGGVEAAKLTKAFRRLSPRTATSRYERPQR